MLQMSEPVPRQFVTCDQIVREALGLLDEVGFHGLTTRRLAERLGIQSPSVYNVALAATVVGRAVSGCGSVDGL